VVVDMVGGATDGLKSDRLVGVVLGEGVIVRTYAFMGLDHVVVPREPTSIDTGSRPPMITDSARRGE